MTLINLGHSGADKFDGRRQNMSSIGNDTQVASDCRGGTTVDIQQHVGKLRTVVCCHVSLVAHLTALYDVQVEATCPRHVTILLGSPRHLRHLWRSTRVRHG